MNAEKEKDTGVDLAIGCAGYVLFAPVFVVLNAYTLTSLWNWFAVPFFDVRAMTPPFAAGLMLLLNWLIRRDTPKSPERVSELLVRFILFGFAMPALVFTTGWIIHRWWLS